MMPNTDKIIPPYYSTEKKTILQVDALKKALGASLIQDGMLV